jgi:hypothetical protein
LGKQIDAHANAKARGTQTARGMLSPRSGVSMFGDSAHAYPAAP